MLVSGGHSSLLRVERRDHRRRAAGRDHRRRGGRGLRQGRPAARACRSRAARTSTARPAPAAAVAIDFPRGLTSRRDLERHRFDFSFSGLKTAVARWVEAREAPASRCRSPTSPRRSRRRSATCSPARRSTPPPPRASRTSSSAAASRRTRGCGSWPRSGPPSTASGCGCRARGCAPTTAPWSPRSAPRWSPAAGRRPRSTCPPTPAMPVDQVLV